ncbi:MAG: DEAD/DEAH box helicase, partial [Candidatus Magasanikbacteria bacterium]|nr:DEAD/DEAH box helicase [Candidatus Magasanikbacteria bacterium]
MKTFKDFGLSAEIQASLDALGFVKPTPIQAKTIPFILKSRQDLIALAQTGTGKTAGFALPIIQQIESDSRELQAIVLCPTRELCLQITKDIESFLKD